MRLPPLFGLLLTSLPTIVVAATPPWPPAGTLPVGSWTAANVIGGSLVPVIITLLLNISAGLAVVFVMIGGGLYLTSFGDDSKHEKAKNTIVYALGGLAIAISSHLIVRTINSAVWGCIGCEIVTQSILPMVATALLTILNGVFVLMVLIGGMRHVSARGKDDEISKARKMIIYACVGAVIVNLARLLTQAVIGLNLNP